MKFFRAVHRENKEVTEFGLEDIHPSSKYFLDIGKSDAVRADYSIPEYFDEMKCELYYNHDGQWYPYKDEGGV